MIFVSCVHKTNFAQDESQKFMAEALLRGVKKIGRPGLPGPIAVINKTATPLVVAEVKGKHHLPVIASARYGKGAALVFGHNGFLSKAHLTNNGPGRLILNFLSHRGFGADHRIGVVSRPGVDEFLTSSKLNTTPLESRSWQKSLGSCQAIVLGQGDIRSAVQVLRLQAWVKDGGILVTGGLIWGWRQLNPNLDFARDHGLNQVLAPMGLFLSDGTIGSIVQPDEANDQMLWSTSAENAFGKLREHKAKKKVSRNDLAQAGHVVTSALRSIPMGQEHFITSIRALIGTDSLNLIPSVDHPLTTKDVFPRLAITVEHLLSLKMAPEDIRAAPSATDFPGQPAAEEQAVATTKVLNLRRPGWHSLGLFARAGQPVKITFPKEKMPTGTRLRIGCHSDEVWSKRKWLRHPEVSRSWSIGQSGQSFASPHGGLVYVEIPRRLQAKSLTVTIEGAVPSLHFVLGVTDPKKWQEDLKNMTAPWAELECDLVTLTVKRESAARLQDPTDLMDFWMDILKLYPRLGERPLDRRPQRFVSDRQLSLGWLHSGYPIMMQLIHSDSIVDLAKLRDAPKDEHHGWGFWHELGHNHQRPAWTFSGTTEVTCNLFSLFVDDKIRGIKPVSHPWARGSRMKISPFINKDRHFARWKKDPGLALWTYILIQEEFGWAPFQKVFAEFEAAKRADLPKSDDEKRDQFLVRLSRACNRDFGPYFEAWGIPVSNAARLKIAELKPWLPTRIKAFQKFDR